MLLKNGPKDGGYLMIDHRASPGLPEDIARAAGLDPALCKEGKIFEAASLTCAHCKVAVVKNPLRVRERATCSKCSYHYICDFCAEETCRPDYSHLPFEKKADMAMNFAEKGEVLGSPQKLILPSD